MRAVELQGSETPGFDLDDVCTCDRRPGTKYDGASSCDPPAEIECDDDGGIDNRLASLVTLIHSATPDSGRLDDVARRVIDEGRRTLLVEIADYDGRPNDAEVTVSIVLSVGLHEPSCPGSALTDPRLGYHAPGWCGEDRWTVSQRSMVGSTSVPIVLARGYVHDYVLVARFDTTLSLPFSDSSSLVLERFTLSGTLTPLKEGSLEPRDPNVAPTKREERLWRFRGSVGGRSSTDNLLVMFGSYQGRLDSAPICTTSAFPVIRSWVCTGADLSTADDHGGKRCDALSTAVGLTAEPALRGAVSGDGGITLNDCSPENVDASLYRCP